MKNNILEINLGGKIRNYVNVGSGVYRFEIEPLSQKREENLSSVSVDETKQLVSNCTMKNMEDVLVLVEASKLSLNDRFMQYKPVTQREREFKQELTEAIQEGLCDFYRPKYDPSFMTSDNKQICFVKGALPATNRMYYWWSSIAKSFLPERNSRLGTRKEYIAFLGVLIKKLMEEEDWSDSEAWGAVCVDSSKLGTYYNTRIKNYEKTGGREICGFCDLANTYKILASDDVNGAFWVAGGTCISFSSFYPLANIEQKCYKSLDIQLGTGWIIFS